MFTTTRSDLIPQDAEPIPTGLALHGVEVYTYQNRKGQPSLIAFSGNRQKPDLHYYYHTEQERERKINQYLEGLHSKLDYVAKRKAARVLSQNPLQVGDILTGSWGYEQTNPEAWQVVEVRGQSVKVTAIGFEHIRANCGMSAYVRPVKDDFVKRNGTGKPDTCWKRVQTHDNGKTVYLGFKHYSATLWSGREMYHSWYG